MNNLISRATAMVLASVGLALAVIQVAAAQDLPPLPDSIKKVGVVRAGVKCDYPPDGFLDQQGKPQGVEVSLVKQIAAYAFGSPDKVELTCVTAANRIPALQGGKVVDFSTSYAWGGSDVLLPQGSTIKSLKELGGKNVIAMKGAWQIPWFEKNVPTANVLKLDSVSDGLQALLQGRADAFAHDQDVLRPIAKRNPKVKLLGEVYQLGTRAAAVRKDEKEWLAYVNGAIAKAYREGQMTKWIRQYVDPDLQDLVIETWDMGKAPKNAG